jgi:hypothetical protein
MANYKVEGLNSAYEIWGFYGGDCEECRLKECDTDVSEVCIVFIIRLERISELGTVLAVTSNWSTLRRNTNYTERIRELGKILAVTSNWNTLRRNTNYM